MEFNNNTVQQQQAGSPSPVPMPQQPAGSPMTNQQQASQMERLYQQMRQGSTQGAPTTMQQGSGYAPQQSQTQQQQQPQQPQQPQQKVAPASARDRVQGNQQPANNVDDNSGDSGKSKMSPKTILIAVGLGIAVIVVMLIFSQLNNAAEEENNPNQSVDEFGNPIDPNAPDDGLVFIEPNETPFMYEFDQVEELRAAGYTGQEIEENEKNQVPYEDLIKQAEDARQAWIDEAIKPLYDTASDEYKQSVSKTWLGLTERTDITDFETTGSYYEETKNLDYEKVEPRGHQLYIKIYLSDSTDDYFFLNVEPSDYLRLKDSGNVVVTYRYVTAVTYNEESGVFEEHQDQNFIVSATLMIYD